MWAEFSFISSQFTHLTDHGPPMAMPRLHSYSAVKTGTNSALGANVGHEGTEGYHSFYFFTETFKHSESATV